MLRFSEYVDIQELSLRSFVSNIKSMYRKLLAKIKFGSKVSIPINMKTMTEQVDLKSRLGYLSEYATAMELSKILTKQNMNLTERSTLSVTKKLYNTKKKELVALKAPSSEIDRQESAGKIMAQQIFEDIITSEDLGLLTFDIEMTGDSGKGKTKADLILHVIKDPKKKAIDKIFASLKAYKSSSINLSNSTFISLIKTLFYDNPSSLPSKSSDFIVKFAKDYGSAKELNELLALQNIIGTEMKAGKSKENARKIAKTTHGDVIKIISKIFKKYYKKNKEQIDARMLKMLGFDGEDDFYAAIGTPGKMGIISSRHSEELKELMTQLRLGFNLSIARNGNTNNADILFKGIDGKVFVKGTITFADTGGANPQGKTNTFVDFRKFVKKK